MRNTFIFKILKYIISILRIYKAYFYDINRFIKYSNSFNLDNTIDKLRSTIILNYHIIEKGLTMNEMKLGFGQEKVLYLCDKCEIFISKYGNTDNQVNHAIEILEEYVNIHKNYTLSNIIIERIEKLSKLKSINYTSKNSFDWDNSNIQSESFPIFAKSRKSFRNFSDKNIPIELINKAIEIAQSAPSACNRQPSRIHVYSNKNDINTILAIQNGNRGFGHLSNKLIIVSCDLSGYKTHNERNACWVDGGIYIMNLLYALHYEGIGTCVLNWGVDKSKDLKMRDIAKIPNQESIIAIITCGFAKEGAKVACSLKKNSTEITTFH